MAAEEEAVDAMEAPRQSLLEVVQEKLAEKGLVSERDGVHIAVDASSCLECTPSLARRDSMCFSRASGTCLNT